VLDWLQRRDRFTDKNAPHIFQGLLVILAILFTGYLVNFRVIATGWAKDDVIYASVEEKFRESGINSTDVVIVRNPPGYYVRTRRSAILLPLGDESTILEIAKRYNAQYLVLEKENSLKDLQDLYDDPQANPGFIYLGEAAGAHLYRITSKP